jgi:hypothetical protein
MSRRLPVTLLIALCAFAVPRVIVAQEMPAQVKALIEEKTALDAKLLPLQQQALAEPALKAQQEELVGAVRKAMVATNPAIGASLDRFEALMVEARAAQQTGDAEKVAALGTEARALQPQIEEAQALALAQPELSAQVTAFKSKMEAQIIAIDPNARQLLERSRELEQQILKAVGNQ